MQAQRDEQKMPSHVIHLGDAWEPPAAAGDRIRLERRFGRPSGLAAGDRVILLVADAAVTADVVVNGSPLPAVVGGEDRWAHDITPLLRDRNHLILEVAAGSVVDADERGKRGRGRPPAAVGTVTIEIVTDA